MPESDTSTQRGGYSPEPPGDFDAKDEETKEILKGDKRFQKLLDEIKTNR